MKKRLGMSSTEILARYTRTEIEQRTSHPLLFLKMAEDEGRSCPFMKPVEGCTIYTDRPAACRYYPVGQGTHRVMDDENEVPVNDEFYVIVKEDHCRGFEEKQEWTVQEWREDQEAALYDGINQEWKKMMMKVLTPGDTVDPRRQQIFFMASYDIDRFRRFVFESRFLEVIELSEAELEKMGSDDVELLGFAVEYIKHAFGIPNKVRVRKDAVREVQERMEAAAAEHNQAREDAEKDMPAGS
jgi:hypothetical protein